MSVPVDPQIDTTLRKEQLITLNKNLHILREREAKYEGNAPLDLLNQIDDHRKAIDLIQQALSGQITEEELNEALKPLLLALRNGQVIKISVPQPRYLRPVVWATLGVVIVILSGVIFLVFRVGSRETEQQVFSTPEDLFQPVEFPGSDWSVTALTTNNEGDKSTLWIGAKSGSKYALFKADTTLKENAKPEKMLEVDGGIIGLTADCKGNIWILMEVIGTRVFRPETREHNTLLNIETTNHWLSKDTMNTVATRCKEDGTVEVWLGRERIHTLLYQSDYPSLEPKTITFLPTESEPDQAYASQEVNELMALSYVTKTQTLWAATSSGTLLTLPQKKGFDPKSANFEDSLRSLAYSLAEEAMWVGADNHLIRKKDRIETIPMEIEEGKQFYNRAVNLAVDDRWVWFGDPCPKEPCVPLGVYNYQHIMPVKIDQYKHVNAITTDGNGAVWIGTENGLLFYPSANK